MRATAFSPAHEREVEIQDRYFEPSKMATEFPHIDFLSPVKTGLWAGRILNPRLRAGLNAVAICDG